MDVRVFLFRIVSRAQYGRIISTVKMLNKRVDDAMELADIYDGELPPPGVILSEHPDIMESIARMNPSVEYWANDELVLNFGSLFANSRQTYITFTTELACNVYCDAFSDFSRDFFGQKKPRWFNGTDDGCRLMPIPKCGDQLDVLPTYGELAQWTIDSLDPEYVYAAPTEPRDVRMNREEMEVHARHSQASKKINEERFRGKHSTRVCKQTEHHKAASSSPSTAPQPAQSRAPATTDHPGN